MANFVKKSAGQFYVVFALACICIFLAINYDVILASINGFSLIASWKIIFIAIVCFFSSHILKLLRYYLILIESGISFFRYVKVYCTTTLVNILIPFKLGEIFRFAVVAKETRSKAISLLSILTERFFDTCIIVAILFFNFQANDLVYKSIAFLLLIFAISLFAAYSAYPVTAKYLRDFFLYRMPPKKIDVVILRALDTIDKLYEGERRSIKSREIVLFLTSAFSWLFEYFYFLCIAKIIQKLNFDSATFSRYIIGLIDHQSVNTEMMLYIYQASAIVIYAIVCLFYALWFLKNRTKEKNEL